MLILWPLLPNASFDSRRKCCIIASECACAIMKVGRYDEVDKYRGTDAEYKVRLRLHCGLACGVINFFRVGHPRHHEELIGGKCIAELKSCLDESKRGMFSFDIEV